MTIKISQKTENGQNVTTFHINGNKHSSISVKNPQIIEQIINLSYSLTTHERDLLSDLLDMID